MADQKITDLTAATALARADLVEVVQDVATTPVNRKATLDVLDPGNTLGGTANDATSVVAGAVTAGGTTNCVVIGVNANAPNSSEVVDAVIIGHGASRSAVTSSAGPTVAVGKDATARTSDCVALGPSSTAGGSGFGSRRDVAVGSGASATGDESVAIGYLAASNVLEGVAVGAASDATTTGAVAVGFNAQAQHTDAVALGRNTLTTAADQVMVGPRDIEITGIVKGLVLEDRTLGTRHRVYLDNGTLTIEAA